MAMTALQVTAELERKKRLGVNPTNTANMGQYNKLGAGANAGAAKAVDPLGAGNSYVRKTLLDNGFANDDIGYDNTRKMVTLQGKDFLSPTKSINGSSIAGSGDISSALSNFRNTEDIKKRNDLMGRMETAMETPYKAPEFNYDPETDPVYQAALRRAQANAGTASGNAQAEMNRRGILNSTITGDRIAQIQQSEYGRVSDEILPKLFDQAYGRYRDTVGDGREDYRNSIGDLGNLVTMGSDLNQRDRDNTYRDQTFNRGVLESDRGFNRGVLESDRGFNRGVLESDRGFNRGVLESDRGFNRGVLESDRSFGLSRSNSGADNSRANTSASFNRLMDIWSATGKAPAGLESYGIQPGAAYKPESAASAGSSFSDKMEIWRASGIAPEGIPGVAPGTRYGGEQGSKPPSSNDIESEYARNLGQMSPEQVTSFFKNEKSQIIKDIGINGYNSLYGLYFDQNGFPRTR